MAAFLSFLKDFQYVIYFILLLVSLRYFYRLFQLQVRLEKTLFGLELTLLLRERNRMLGMLALLLGLGGVIFLSANYLLPGVRAAEQSQAAAIASDLTPTVPFTATPYILFGVDVGGCSNPLATIMKPKPGETVQGAVSFTLTVNIDNLAYYKLELGTPDVAGLWTTLFTGNEAVIAGPPTAGALVDGTPVPHAQTFVWDSSTVPPGVYHLRLTAFAGDGTSPAACVVPIQVLSPLP